MTNKENNFENDEVGRLLGSLKRVDAPGDFDFRVRAHIAAGQPATKGTWLPITARVTAVASIMLAAGYFGFRSFYSPPPTPQQASSVPAPIVRQTAAVQPQTPQVAESVPSNNARPRDEIALRSPNADEKVVGSARQSKGPKVNKKGGSFDVSLGISSPRAPRKSARDSLSEIGIGANASGSDWAVSEVKQNSAAERSGLKVGDIIVGGKVGKTVRVRRDGKIVQIELKP